MAHPPARGAPPASHRKPTNRRVDVKPPTRSGIIERMMSRSGMILIATGVLVLAGLAWWSRTALPPKTSSSDRDNGYRDQAAALLR